MPQITLKVSSNIDINLINFKDIFTAIHVELGKMPHLDITTCNSGVLQEVYSYIGSGDEKASKVYLEVLWLESEERAPLKHKLGKQLMNILETMLVPQIIDQGLICIPRVRIDNLGIINLNYHIGEHGVLSHLESQ